MASSVQTRGYGVQMMPSVQLLDPRLFGGAADAAFGGLRSGIGTAAGIQNLLAASEAMQEDRAIRPIRRQLLKAEVANAPLAAELAKLRLREASEQAAIPRFITGDIDFVDQTQVFPAALDEQGNPTGEDETVIGDLVRRTKRKQIVNGNLVDAEPLLEVIKPAAVRRSESEKEAAAIRATEALATQRLSGKETEFERTQRLYDAAQTEGDSEAAALYKARLDRLSTQPGILPEGTAYRRRVETLAADAGIPLTSALEMAKTPEGAKTLSDLAVRAKAAARNPLAAFGPAPAIPGQSTEAAPVDAIADAIALSTGGAPASSSSVQVFNSEADAEKAAKAGRLKKGQRIRIGNQTGTWQ
jgi:hypothetical protein